jgi:hypothetical protein
LISDTLLLGRAARAGNGNVSLDGSEKIHAEATGIQKWREHARSSRDKDGDQRRVKTNWRKGCNCSRKAFTHPPCGHDRNAERMPPHRGAEIDD